MPYRLREVSKNNNDCMYEQVFILYYGNHAE